MKETVFHPYSHRWISGRYGVRITELYANECRVLLMDWWIFGDNGIDFSYDELRVQPDFSQWKLTANLLNSE